MKSANQQRKKVIIVGGGTAGWMTANIFAFVWQREPIDVCVIESDKIETIGVGEGSTPALKGFFDHLGIAESTWMPRCNATYKCGIDFRGWSSHPGFSHYFHPFPSSFDRQTSPLFMRDVEMYRKGKGARAQPDDYFLSAQLAKQGLSPKSPQVPDKAVTYGYHFDAALLGKFLLENAAKLGVEHITDTVDDVELSESGDIKALKLNSGITKYADFYVDCTGFRGLLISQTLGTPWISYADLLLNDSAVTLPSPREEDVSPQTVSTALRYGWAWRIPLTNRVGNGYVYSSKYCSPDDAEAELREHLGLSESTVSARHLKMKVGRVSAPWNKNCLAVGLAQGFVEPLEATALLIAQQIASIFANNIRKGGLSDEGKEEFNQHINEFFDGIRDYIVTHYKTNSVKSSDYWRDARDQSGPISEDLQAIFSSWQAGDLIETIKSRRLERFYSASSWYCLLAGVGMFDGEPPSDLHNSERTQDTEAIGREFRRLSESFVTHRGQLRTLAGRATQLTD